MLTLFMMSQILTTSHSDDKVQNSKHFALQTDDGDVM